MFEALTLFFLILGFFCCMALYLHMVVLRGLLLMKLKYKGRMKFSGKHWKVVPSSHATSTFIS